MPQPSAAGVDLRAVVQLAYAVDDVELAAQQWALRTGAGPFLVRHHPSAAAAGPSGQAAAFDHSSAYGQWGPVQLELVQVHPTTSSSLSAVVPAGLGLHHVAWFADDLAAEKRRLEALGWPCVMTARTAAGQCYAFHDARSDLGHLVEVYEPTDRVRSLYQRVALASLDWDGRDPVRPLT